MPFTARGRFFSLFVLPETQRITDLDSPETTRVHGEIIRKKRLLREIYAEFYSIFRKSLPGFQGQGNVVELGSGGGFIKDIIPGTVTSDMISGHGIDLNFSALRMPFRDRTIEAFVMFNVMHHIPDSRVFLSEAGRCLAPGGRVIMIEPANTLFGRFIYRNFHHEPFLPQAGWSFDSAGPLSSANGALPWIVFCRDRKIFETEYPQFRIDKIAFHTPFRYLLSGGFTLRQLLPSFLSPVSYWIEALLSPLSPFLGMFMTVQLTRMK